MLRNRKQVSLEQHIHYRKIFSEGGQYLPDCHASAVENQASTTGFEGVSMLRNIQLFLNGTPLLTMELKNQRTGQDFRNSEMQYRRDRDPKEPLLGFKRLLAHFCVYNDVVTMTSRFMGEETKFLPYNQGIANPPNADGYRTHYLWEEILSPNSLLDIIENYVHLAKEVDKIWDTYKQKVTRDA